MQQSGPQRIETVVVGGGQAGLAVGYHLARAGRRFVILDASRRVGDAWRRRWDSLRVFTPSRFDALPGLPFPAPATSYPSKDQVADYLEAYAARFDLPVRSGLRVLRLAGANGRFLVSAKIAAPMDARGADGPGRDGPSTDAVQFEADNVVVAMSGYQQPRLPDFADDLDPAILRMHSSEYRNPGDLAEGGVLVVGAANSGCEIALEVASGHATSLSGRAPPEVPFRLESAFGRLMGVPLVIGLAFHHFAAVDTPLGRRLRKRMFGGVGPNVRVKSADLAAAGVERLPRVAAVRDGLPVLEDDRVIEPDNVIWCTGFRPDFGWIDLPVFGDGAKPGEPRHESGIVPDVPGLYFVGLFFLHALSSSLLRGVGRDAKRVAGDIAARGSA